MKLIRERIKMNALNHNSEDDIIAKIMDNTLEDFCNNCRSLTEEEKEKRRESLKKISVPTGESFYDNY